MKLCTSGRNRYGFGGAETGAVDGLQDQVQLLVVDLPLLVQEQGEPGDSGVGNTSRGLTGRHTAGVLPLQQQTYHRDVAAVSGDEESRVF